MALESFVDRLADSEQNLYQSVSLRFHLEISRTGLVKDGRMTNDCRVALRSRKVFAGDFGGMQHETVWVVTAKGEVCISASNLESLVERFCEIMIEKNF